MADTKKLDENGNPIVDENEEETPEDNEQEDETDYKSLYEKEKADREKFEWRFKKTAKELNEIKKLGSSKDVDVASIVSKQVAEEMYYANNPTAKEFQKEIKEIQAKTWMSPEDAMTFYIAKNKPELLWKKSETWVDGVTKAPEATKDVKDMTYDDLRPKDKQRG